MRKLLLIALLLLIEAGTSLNAGTIEEYQKACNNGDAGGCNRLGIMYIKGREVKQNYLKAMELFKKSCSMGSVEGCKKHTITNSLIGHIDLGTLPNQIKQQDLNLTAAQAPVSRVKAAKNENSDNVYKKDALSNNGEINSDISTDWTSSILKEGNQHFNELKNKTIKLYSEDIEIQNIYSDKSKRKRMDGIWNDTLDKLKEGASYAEELNSAPKSSWFKDDKEDVQENINEVLEDIFATLTGDDLMMYRNKIASLKKNIHQNKSDILTYREKRISAPINSIFSTTKSEYDEKIKKDKEENAINENKIRIVKNSLKKNFSEIGVNLTSEQVDVLLARIDGDDIIQMSLMMDVLRYITNQIMGIMKESNEELSQAKKYYGMHLVLLELVVYIQQKYIDKIDSIYIPKIDNIMAEAKKMIAETNHLKFSEEDIKRKAVYEKNIGAQQLTYKVAKLYKNDMIKSKNSISNAQKISRDNLVLSKNIYATVLLSADLYELVSESQNMFEEVSKIQVPDIEPFDNIQIQKKYKELTGLLQEK